VFAYGGFDSYIPDLSLCLFMDGLTLIPDVSLCLFMDGLTLIPDLSL
jgi:hypothetical protein